MAVLTKDAILTAQDFQVERVNVPEWGGEVCLRPLSCREVERFQDELTERRRDDGRFELTDLRASLLSKAICDESGVPLFTAEDVEALGKKNNAVMDRLFAMAREISGMDDAVEDTEKNSEAGRIDS